MQCTTWQVEPLPRVFRRMYWFIRFTPSYLVELKLLETLILRGPALQVTEFNLLEVSNLFWSEKLYFYSSWIDGSKSLNDCDRWRLGTRLKFKSPRIYYVYLEGLLWLWIPFISLVLVQDVPRSELSSKCSSFCGWEFNNLGLISSGVFPLEARVESVFFEQLSR